MMQWLGHEVLHQKLHMYTQDVPELMGQTVRGDRARLEKLKTPYNVYS